MFRSDVAHIVPKFQKAKQTGMVEALDQLDKVFKYEEAHTIKPEFVELELTTHHDHIRILLPVKVFRDVALVDQVLTRDDPHFGVIFFLYPLFWGQVPIEISC